MLLCFALLCRAVTHGMSGYEWVLVCHFSWLRCKAQKELLYRQAARRLGMGNDEDTGALTACFGEHFPGLEVIRNLDY